MVTVEECVAFSGLASGEIILGATPCNTHRVLLSGYLLKFVARSKSCPQNDRRRRAFVAGPWNDQARGGPAAHFTAVSLRDYPESRLAHSVV